MLRYIIRRIIWLIPVLFFVSLITFSLMHLVPGGPWSGDRNLPAGECFTAAESRWFKRLARAARLLPNWLPALTGQPSINALSTASGSFGSRWKTSMAKAASISPCSRPASRRWRFATALIRVLGTPLRSR